MILHVIKLESSKDNVRKDDKRRFSERLKNKKNLKEIPKTCEIFDVEDNWSDDSQNEYKILKEEITNNFDQTISCLKTITKKENTKCIVKNSIKYGEIKCDFCQAVCRSRKLYEKHILRHYKKPIFQCNECLCTFKQRLTLIYHIQVVHLEIFRETEECPICHKRVMHLNAHIGGHNNTRFMCEICQKKFTKNAFYMKHMLSHTNKNHLSCHICTRNFRRQSDLRRHLMKHEKQRDKTGNYLPLKLLHGLCDRLTDDKQQLSRSTVQYRCRSCDTSDLQAYASLVPDEISSTSTDISKTNISSKLHLPDMTGDEWENVFFNSRSCDTSDMEFYFELLQHIDG